MRKRWYGILFLLLIGKGMVAQNSFSVSNRIPHYMDLNPDNFTGQTGTASFQFSQWINYTTLVDQYEPAAFSVTVQMVPVRAPKGLGLSVEAGPYRGISKGNVGTPTGLKEVGRAARVLIDNITTSFTGSESGMGHPMVLKFSAPFLSPQDTVSYRVSIVYTLVQ